MHEILIFNFNFILSFSSASRAAVAAGISLLLLLLLFYVFYSVFSAVLYNPIMTFHSILNIIILVDSLSDHDGAGAGVVWLGGWFWCLGLVGAMCSVLYFIYISVHMHMEKLERKRVCSIFYGSI